MKKEFAFDTLVPELEMILKKGPITASLIALAKEVDLQLTLSGALNQAIRKASKTVLAATDPWADVLYQSLYIRGEDPEDRVVLQEPPTREPTVGMMVLKAARLQGESGIVFCGTENQLKTFKDKLPEYEKRGKDLDEMEFIDCLAEAAEASGLKVVFTKISVEHGGSEDDID